MIEHLSATNFRRFEHIDLRFDDDAQLILIDGNNGAGKTTILEAIHFALWGESRSGKRRLDALVRRGAELEGMQVELTFVAHGERYRINRRRDGRSSTAVLFCNEDPLVEGPNEVTEEVGNILGMDSAGFRLAVTAQQGDLEGLVSLRPAERARMVGRLLRLDAIAAAKQAAADQSRNERTLAQKLSPSDHENLDELLAQLTEEAEGVSQEHESAEAAVGSFKSLLNELRPLAEQHRERVAEYARLTGRVQMLQQQIEETSERVEQLAEESGSAEEGVDVAELEHQAAVLGAELARAEASVDRARHRRSLQRDLDDVEARLREISEVEAPEEPASDVAAAQNAADAAEEEANLLRRERDLAEEHTSSLQQRRALSEVCEECGQKVSEQHRARHQQKQEKQQLQAEERLELAQKLLDAAEKALKERREELSSARKLAGDWQLARQSHLQMLQEEKALAGRVSTYRSRIAELPEVQTDPKPIAERLRELEKALPAARLAAEKQRSRQKRAAEREMLQERLKELAVQRTKATQEAEAAEPDLALKEAAEREKQAAEQLESEQALLRHWDTRKAVLSERISGIRRQRKQQQQQADRASEHQKAAENAAGAQRILQEAGGQMARRIRPELEGAISSLLSQMSEGRFTRVTLDEEYNLGVLDDGEFRDIADLSGGEADLIAIAMRLALAQVFTARNGGSGAGFLILDECFGSQDPGRRRAILDALRELRSQYRQIFVISHVEGLEESADLVLHVQRYSDEPSEVQAEA